MYLIQLTGCDSGESNTWVNNLGTSIDRKMQVVSAIITPSFYIRDYLKINTDHESRFYFKCVFTRFTNTHSKFCLVLTIDLLSIITDTS